MAKEISLTQGKIQRSMNDPKGTYAERLPINIASALAREQETNAPQQIADELLRIIKWMRDHEPVTVSQIMEVLRVREGVNRVEAIRKSRSTTAPTPVDGTQDDG